MHSASNPIRVLILLAAAVLGQVSPGWSAVAPRQDPETTVDKAVEAMVNLGRIEFDEVKESSGLAISSRPDAVWTINDSGNPARLYLLETTGQLLTTVSLPEVKNVDWESLSECRLSDRRWLVIADVGDNSRQRNQYQLYWLPEPNVTQPGKRIAKLPKPLVIRQDFFYPQDRPAAATPNQNRPPARNCEAIAVNPRRPEVWLVEKIELTQRADRPPGIFVLDLPQAALESRLSSGSNTPIPASEAVRIGDFPIRNVTGMAFSPDGDKLIVRNYFSAHLYRREGDHSWRQTIAETKPIVVGLPLQRQGEAVCFTPDSRSILLTSETEKQPIWQISLESYFKQPIRR